MPAFRAQIDELDKKRSERMNFRTMPHIKSTIQRAAALSGVDVSVFTLSAAYKAALEIIAAQEMTQLQPIDHAAFFTLLDNPPAPTTELKAAFDRYENKLVVSDK